MVENLAAASEVYLSEGITSCQETGVGGILGIDEPLELRAYQRARRDGRLRVRVTLMPSVETLHSGDHHPDDDEPFALDLGLHTGFGDQWLKFGPVKIFADGSLIGRTAAMFDDFDGEPGNRGYFQMDEAKLHSLIVKAHRSGWQVATHAIGDRHPDCYRQRSFLDAGVVLPGSSDRPVVKGSPLLGIHAVVNQRTGDGAPFNPHEAISAEEALRSYTLHSAHAAFDEDLKGSVTPGKLADLTVLDRDLTTIAPETIADTTVEATLVGGVAEFDRADLF